MNHQPEKEEKGGEKPLHPLADAVVAEGLPPKPKRGRPRSSPHDLATQNRLRVQRHRDAKREGDAVPVEIYLPKAWHAWLVDTRGANLREVAVEAFALWLKKEGFAAALPAPPPDPKDA